MTAAYSWARSSLSHLMSVSFDPIRTPSGAGSLARWTVTRAQVQGRDCLRRTIDLDATRKWLTRLPGMAIPLRLDRPPMPGRFVRGVYLSTPFFVAFDYIYGV